MASVGPEQHVLSLDERRKVWEVLGKLSEQDRMALFLRDQLDMRYTDIAQVLEISRAAARMRVFRARERFRGTTPNSKLVRFLAM